MARQADRRAREGQEDGEHPTVVARISALAILLACRPAIPETPPPREQAPIDDVAPTPSDVPPPAPAAPELPPIEMRFVGNEGFMVRVEDAAVLFDAVLGRGLAHYPVPSREERAKIERGEPPFDGVVVAFASHHHADHFDAGAAVRFLDGHDAAHLVTTDQAVRRMDRKAATRHRARIHGLAPAADAPVDLEIGPVAIRAFDMHHGKGGARNLGFVVTIGGRKLLHVGDTVLSAAELEALPVSGADRPVDVAMIPYWQLAQDDWVAALENTFAQRQIVVMHLPSARAPQALYGRGHTRASMLEELRERFGEEAIFDENDGTRVFQPQTQDRPRR